jgi:uncharacterized membrane protein
MSKRKNWLKTGAGELVAYFLQGLLLIAPTFVTLWAIFAFFNFFDSHINDLFEQAFHFRAPGFGLVTVVLLITLIGVLGSLVIVQPLLHIIDLILEKTPVVKDIYTALKDFFNAFISNKKKFNKPAMFEMGKGSGVFKLGFITQEDLSELHIKDKVAVYTPLSYNLSGILYLVNSDQVQPLENVSNGMVMKFIVSGGVTEIDDETHHNHHPKHVTHAGLNDLSTPSKATNT